MIVKNSAKTLLKYKTLFDKGIKLEMMFHPTTDYNFETVKPNEWYSIEYWNIEHFPRLNIQFRRKKV